MTVTTIQWLDFLQYIEICMLLTNTGKVFSVEAKGLHIEKVCTVEMPLYLLHSQRKLKCK